MIVKIQVIRRNTLPLTNWMSQIAVLIHPPAECLSGQAIWSQIVLRNYAMDILSFAVCVQNEDWAFINDSGASLEDCCSI